MPARLDVMDRDQAGSPNSKITVSLISQEPKEPKISLVQLYNTQAQLQLKSGCFDYDVSLCKFFFFFLTYFMSASIICVPENKEV